MNNRIVRYIAYFVLAILLICSIADIYNADNCRELSVKHFEKILKNKETAVDDFFKALMLQPTDSIGLLYCEDNAIMRTPQQPNHQQPNHQPSDLQKSNPEHSDFQQSASLQKDSLRKNSPRKAHIENDSLQEDLLQEDSQQEDSLQGSKSSNPNWQSNCFMLPRAKVNPQTHEGRSYRKSASSPDYHAIAAKHHDITFLVFAGDSLIYWSNNSIDADSATVDRLSSTPYGKIDNAYYLVKTMRNDSLQAFGLILIRKDFPTANKFLISEYNPAFKLSKGTCITGNPNSDEQPLSLNICEQSYRYRSPRILTYGFTIALILLLICLYRYVISQAKRHRYTRFIIVTIALAVLRHLMYIFHLPKAFYNLDLFNRYIIGAKDTALSTLTGQSSHTLSTIDTIGSSTPIAQGILDNLQGVHTVIAEGMQSGISSGDFLLNSVFLFFVLYLLVKIPFAPRPLRKDSLRKEPSQNDSSRIIRTVSFPIFILLIYSLLTYIISSLGYIIRHTDIAMNLSNWKDITPDSYVLYISLLPLLLVITLAIYRIVSEFKTALSALVQLLVSILIPVAAAAIFGVNLTVLCSAAILISSVAIALYAENVARPDLKYSFMLFSLFIISSVMVFFIEEHSVNKEQLRRKEFAHILFEERDTILEQHFKDLSSFIRRSKPIDSLMQRPYAGEDKIEDIINQYSKDFITDKYSIQTTVCESRDSLLIEMNGSLNNCFEFFGAITDSSEKISGTSFWYINRFDGLISYLGVIPFPKEKLSYNLYIRIFSTSESEGAGYPQLLKGGAETYSPVYNRYSWAKYKDNSLIASSGSFNYMYSGNSFNDYNRQFTLTDDYSHYIVNRGNDRVVVSIPAETVINKLLNIPYIFGLFCLISIIMWLLIRFPFDHSEYVSFKVRIRTALITILIVFFIIIGSLSIYYNSVRFKERHYDKIVQLMKLVSRELEFVNPYPSENSEITSQLVALSNMIFTDINIYDTKGRLISTSRPEIFERKIISRLIDPIAYQEISSGNLSYYIQNEKIGRLSYLSAYIPLINSSGNTVAYINVPYFSENSELTEEIFNLIITGVNINVLMIILAVFISVFISDKITYPLSLVYNKLKEMKFDGKYEKINYEQNDEIGRLVKEYNLMTEQLKESAKSLARSERESAWGEMARQIAHEIKNPLTPMKLNIQFMQQTVRPDNEKDREKFRKICSVLVEQIDNMAAIAQAFSDFSKMPLAKFSKLNATNCIESAVELFSKSRTTITVSSDSREIFVYADREQLTRALVNLIKNAVQATAEVSNPKVSISIKLTGSNSKNNGSSVSNISSSNNNNGSNDRNIENENKSRNNSNITNNTDKDISHDSSINCNSSNSNDNNKTISDNYNSISSSNSSSSSDNNNDSDINLSSSDNSSNGDNNNSSNGNSKGNNGDSNDDSSSNLPSSNYNQVCIEICDNGTGIPDDVRNKIFQPNFTTKTSGTGLGLAITKKIIENFNGTITFHSAKQTNDTTQSKKRIQSSKQIKNTEHSQSSERIQSSKHIQSSEHSERIKNSSEYRTCFTITLPLYHKH